jgi:hypothetical protein
MPKCSFCGAEANESMLVNTYNGVSKDDVHFYYCCEEHKNEIKKYTDYVNKNATKFIVLILIDMLLFSIGMPIAFSINNFYLSLIFSVIPTIALGYIINKYPFATPNTNKSFKIEKSIRVTKILGVIIILIGIIIALGMILYKVIV